MKLRLSQEVKAFKVVDGGKKPTEDTTIPAGEHEFEQIPNPMGGTGTEWLVRKSDRTIGKSVQAMLSSPGVTEVKEATAPAGEAETKEGKP